MHYIYILRCSDNTLYIGRTTDVPLRVAAHNAGRGATYTYKRRPVRLVYTEPHPNEKTAARRERQLKRWSHAKKQALVDGDVMNLRHHSRSKE